MKYLGSLMGVSQLSGSAGSTTASHNRFGLYLRNRVTPVNPQTERQLDVRSWFAAAAAAWRQLSQVDQSAWREEGALIERVDSLNRTYTFTGSMYYTSTAVNMKQYLETAGLPTVPADIVLPAAIETLIATAEGGATQTFTVTYTATPLAALTNIQISASVQQSPGINYFGRTRLRVIFTSAAAAASPANIAAAYIARFGALVAGQKILVRARVFSSTGGASQPVDQVVIVGAGA